MTLNRRDLMKITLAEAGLLAVFRPGIATSSMKKSPATKTAIDILIVGAGNAGIPAAIQAADLGANILLVDKNAFVGGMLNISGGHISGANTKMQIAKGIEDSPSLHYRDAMRMGRYKNNSELLKLAVDNAAAMIDWLAEIGVEFTPESPFFEDDHEHYSAARTYMGPEYARSLLKPLKAELQRRIDKGQVTLQLNTTVNQLLQDDDGQVLGAVATDESGQKLRILAKAVIMASGGYGASDTLKKKYNPKIVGSKVVCLPHATGDGIVMAEKVGAKLSNMDVFVSFPGAVDGSSGRLQHAPKHFTEGIWVNSHGERFVNEQTLNPDERERAFLDQSDFGFSYIFDHHVRETNPGILGWDHRRMQQEISKGIVWQAYTIEELAGKIGVNPKALKTTVARYNQSVALGIDSDYGREKLTRPLSTAPFYSVPITGSILISHGGIAVNHLLQAVDTHGRSIEGFFAVGETIGSAQMMGSAVLSGMSVGPAITLGRLVARNAVHHIRGEPFLTATCEQQTDIRSETLS